MIAFNFSVQEKYVQLYGFNKFHENILQLVPNMVDPVGLSYADAAQSYRVLCSLETRL
jgi:hypothetical protein